MVFVSFTVVVILLLFLLFLAMAASADSYEGIPMFLFFGVPVILILTIPVEYHMDDLATIRQGELLIEAREQSLTELNVTLSTMKISNTALMNADSPAKSLIEAKAKQIESISQERMKIAEAKLSIERRSLGFFAGVVEVFGRE